MNTLNYTHQSIYVIKKKEMGRGMYTNAALKKNVVIEIAPVIVMPAKDRALLDQTLLHNYIFEWGEEQKECCMALGYIPLYNHAYKSNCEYEMDFKKEIISVKTIRAIKPGEELFINYNGNWNNKKPVWFDAV